jgi:hypothetical protein
MRIMQVVHAARLLLAALYLQRCALQLGLCLGWGRCSVSSSTCEDELKLLRCVLCVVQVVAGAPGSRLVDLVVAPQVLVQQDNSKSALRLNATYYITKQVCA